MVLRTAKSWAISLNENRMTVIVSVPGNDIAQPAKDLPKQALLPEDLYKYFVPLQYTDDTTIHHVLIGTTILYYVAGHEYIVNRLIPEERIMMILDFYGGSPTTVEWYMIDWNAFKIIDSRLGPYHEYDSK